VRKALALDMFDTHVHSHHSPDSQAPIEALARAAIARGLRGLTLTEHAEWYPEDPAYGFLDMDTYLSELEAVRANVQGEIQVLAGLEMGNPHEFPDEAKALIAAYPLDLVIASVHWIEGEPGWERVAFGEGLTETYERYLREVVAMVSQADFDVLGHLDLVRRDSWALFHRTIPLDGFMDLIDQILCQLIAQQRALEINTSGLRNGLGSTLPDLQILQRYRELGGELVVFGSDSHRPDDLGYGFEVARGLMKAIGLTRIPHYERRQIVGWIRL